MKVVWALWLCCFAIAWAQQAEQSQSFFGSAKGNVKGEAPIAQGAAKGNVKGEMPMMQGSTKGNVKGEAPIAQGTTKGSAKGSLEQGSSAKGNVPFLQQDSNVQSTAANQSNINATIEEKAKAAKQKIADKKLQQPVQKQETDLNEREQPTILQKLRHRYRAQEPIKEDKREEVQDEREHVVESQEENAVANPAATLGNFRARVKGHVEMGDKKISDLSGLLSKITVPAKDKEPERLIYMADLKVLSEGAHDAGQQVHVWIQGKQNNADLFVNFIAEKSNEGQCFFQPATIKNQHHQKSSSTDSATPCQGEILERVLDLKQQESQEKVPLTERICLDAQRKLKWIEARAKAGMMNFLVHLDVISTEAAPVVNAETQELYAARVVRGEAEEQ
jgi:hypothetical protein